MLELNTKNIYNLPGNNLLPLGELHFSKSQEMLAIYEYPTSFKNVKI